MSHLWKAHIYVIHTYMTIYSTQFKAAAEELAKKEAEYEKLFEAAEFLSRERWPEWDGAPVRNIHSHTNTYILAQQYPWWWKSIVVFIELKNGQLRIVLNDWTVILA